MLRLLGIDPGLLNTGWGIIEKHTNDNIKYIACGVIKPPRNILFADRLKHIYDKMYEIISQYSPEIASMEEVFININPESSKKLIMARTASFLACCNSRLNINEFSPTTIKKNVTGNGRSSKAQIHTMVQKILRVTIDRDNINKTFDSMDALAIAICQAFSSPF